MYLWVIAAAVFVGLLYLFAVSVPLALMIVITVIGCCFLDPNVPLDTAHYWLPLYMEKMYRLNRFKRFFIGGDFVNGVY